MLGSGEKMHQAMGETRKRMSHFLLGAEKWDDRDVRPDEKNWSQGFGYNSCMQLRQDRKSVV